MKKKELLKEIYNTNDRRKGYLAYEYYQMSGYPPEFLLEYLGKVNKEEFEKGIEERKKEHQEVSRKSIYRFKR